MSLVRSGGFEVSWPLRKPLQEGGTGGGAGNGGSDDKVTISPREG